VSVKSLIPLYASLSTTTIPLIVYAFPLDRALLRVNKTEMKTMRTLPRVPKSGMGFRTNYPMEFLQMRGYVLLQQILCQCLYN
jgi:hypothetical protein